MTPEQIAASLSENQIWAVRTGLHPTGPRRAPMEKSLRALGLWLPNGKFTDLCQQVRKILEAQ